MLTRIAVTRLHLSRISSVVFSVTAAMSAMAGDFHETDGVAIKGFDPVAYITQQSAVQGASEFTSVYKGSVFRFESARNRDTFIANPEKFAPQYNGYCAYGVSRGYKAATSPEAFSVINGKLYLNYNAEVKAMWAKDVPGFVAKADVQWSEVEKTTKINR